jgi:hypothetical protein
MQLGAQLWTHATFLVFVAAWFMRKLLPGSPWH